MVLAMFFELPGIGGCHRKLPSTDRLRGTGLLPWWTWEHIIFILMGAFLLAVTIRALLSHIQRICDLAVSQERERIALDIHDTLAQSFAGIAFKLQGMRDEVPGENPLRGEIEIVLDMVRRSHNEAKRSITTIRPVFTGRDTNMAESLKQFALRLSNGRSLTIHSSHSHPERHLPQRIADTLFLIGEEAISNSIRHSGATEIDICVELRKDSVELSIRDDGRGFVANVDNYGLGLRGMMRRASLLPAHLEVLSSPGEGTRVVVKAPIVRVSAFAQAVQQRLRRFSKPKV